MGQQEELIKSKGFGPENPTLIRRRESEEGDCALVCAPKLQVDEDIKGSSWQSRVCKWFNFFPPY